MQTVQRAGDWYARDSRALSGTEEVTGLLPWRWGPELCGTLALTSCSLPHWLVLLLPFTPSPSSSVPQGKVLSASSHRKEPRKEEPQLTPASAGSLRRGRGPPSPTETSGYPTCARMARLCLLVSLAITSTILSNLSCWDWTLGTSRGGAKGAEPQGYQRATGKQEVASRWRVAATPAHFLWGCGSAACGGPVGRRGGGRFSVWDCPDCPVWGSDYRQTRQWTGSGAVQRQGPSLGSGMGRLSRVGQDPRQEADGWTGAALGGNRTMGGCQLSHGPGGCAGEEEVCGAEEGLADRKDYGPMLQCQRGQCLDHPRHLEGRRDRNRITVCPPGSVSSRLGHHDTCALHLCVTSTLPPVGRGQEVCHNRASACSPGTQRRGPGISYPPSVPCMEVSPVFLLTLPPSPKLRAE